MRASAWCGAEAWGARPPTGRNPPITELTEQISRNVSDVGSDTGGRDIFRRPRVLALASTGSSNQFAQGLMGNEVSACGPQICGTGSVCTRYSRLPRSPPYAPSAALARGHASKQTWLSASPSACLRWLSRVDVSAAGAQKDKGPPEAAKSRGVPRRIPGKRKRKEGDARSHDLSRRTCCARLNPKP